MPNTPAADTVGMTDAGRKPATTPEDVLDVFDAREDRAEPMTAPELADRLNCSRRTALNKLHTLADAGDVDNKKVGGRSKVWWVPIRGADADTAADKTPPRERREDGATSTRPEPDPTPGEDTDAEHAALTGDEDLRESVRGGLMGSGDVLERRVDAILQMYAHLRDRGTAEKGDLLDAVDPDAVGYADRSSVWANMVKGKDTLRVLPGVRKPSPGKTTWRFDPDAEGAEPRENDQPHEGPNL